MEDKAERVARYQHHTVEALADLVAAAGLSHPSELQPHHIWHRLTPVEAKPLDRLYPFLARGILLDAPQGNRLCRRMGCREPGQLRPRGQCRPPPGGLKARAHRGAGMSHDMSQHLPVRLSAFGAVIEFTCPYVALARGVLRLLPGCCGDRRRKALRTCAIPSSRMANRTPQEPLYQFRENGLLLGDRRTAQQVSTLLAGRMDYHLGEQARTCAFIHAGVVAASGARAAVSRPHPCGQKHADRRAGGGGSEYVSDDVAVIDPRAKFISSAAITLRADVASAIHRLPWLTLPASGRERHPWAPS